MKSAYAAVRVIACSALILLAACDANQIVDPPGGLAQLRLLHATEALGPVDLEVGSTVEIRSVTYGNASAITLVPGGQQHIVVLAGNRILGQFDAALSTAHINTVVVAEGTPQFSTAVTPDTGSAATNRANLRMVNVAGTNTSPPTTLAVKVRAPNAKPDSVLTFGMDAKVSSYGPLMYFDPGHFDFRFTADGIAADLAHVAFDVAAGEKKAVVLERAADGTYKATVVVEK